MMKFFVIPTRNNPSGFVTSENDVPGAEEVTYEEYVNFLSENNLSVIENPNIVKLEDQKSVRYTEVSAACQQAIYDGFDAEVETGTEHFSLKDEDQINLQTANEAIKAGAMGYPYHSDGNLCRLFKADEITTLANAAVQHKLYHTTYCNHLMRWIDRVETVDELNQIYYGADLPEDLRKNMEQVMAGVKTSV